MEMSLHSMEVVNRLTTVNLINLSPTSSVHTHLAYLVFLQGEMVPDFEIFMGWPSNPFIQKLRLHYILPNSAFVRIQNLRWLIMGT